MTLLLEQNFDLHLTDSKCHLRFPFECLSGVAALEVVLEFDPVDTGEISSMVNFTLLENGQFRGAGHRHGGRHKVTLSSEYATPGFLAGPIRAGEWEVVVHTHMVATHTHFRLTVEALNTLEPISEAALESAIQISNRSEKAWMMGDLHSHTTHSDANWTVRDLAHAALERGLSFLALTDHNTLSGRAELERSAPSLLLLPGVELTTYYGHATVIGIEDWLDWTTLEAGRGMGALAGEVARDGGILSIAHPFAPGDPICTGCAWTYFDHRPENATHLEVWNSEWREPHNRAALEHWYSLLESGRRVIATVGSDIHGPAYWEGHGFTCTPTTSSRARLLEQLRAGNTYLARRATLEPRIRTEGGEAELGSVEPAGTWRLELRWEGVSVGSELHVVADGQREVVPLEPEGQWTRAVKVERWLHCEIWRSDGELELLTNPVFAEHAQRLGQTF